MHTEGEVWGVSFPPAKGHHSSAHYHVRLSRLLGDWCVINYWWCLTCPCLLGINVWDENFYETPTAVFSH